MKVDGNSYGEAYQRAISYLHDPMCYLPPNIVQMILKHG